MIYINNDYIEKYAEMICNFYNEIDERNKKQKNMIDFVNSVRELIEYNHKLDKENKKLKSKLESSEKARKKCINRIKMLGKFDGETCTRSLKLWKADFNQLLEILDNKGDEK